MMLTHKQADWGDALPTLKVLILWREGWNTYEIAQELHMREFEVCRLMAYLRRHGPLSKVEVTA